MKRLLLVCLMMTCSVSWAEWEIYQIDDEVTRYLDRETIRKNGDIVKMWDMVDYSSYQDFQGKKYKSAKGYTVYDCKSEARATSALVFYSDVIGRGDVIMSNSRLEKDWQWKPIVPETIGQFVWKIACGKK